MLEWYEAYADYRDTMDRMENLVERVALETLGTTKTTFRGHEIDLKAPWRRVKLIDALEEPASGRATTTSSERALGSAASTPRRTRPGRSSSTRRSRTSSSRALIQPTILYDYPVELSPFARATDDDPGIVERFEYYVGGMELGNAFTRDQRRRGAGAAVRDAGGGGRRRQRRGRAGRPGLRRGALVRHAADGRLGMGIDRLAMVLAGKDSIRDVILFPAAAA